jgi:phosphate transport system permease protein
VISAATNAWPTTGNWRHRRRALGRVFEVVCLVAISLGLLALLVLVLDILRRGLPTLTWEFLNSFPSRFPQSAGIKAALVGSLWVIGLTALFALPTGVAAGVWLEEIGRRDRVSRFVELNIANLAGVPSIIYGLLGLGLFVRMLQLERSILAGALTMALLVLPIIIINTLTGHLGGCPTVGPARHFDRHDPGIVPSHRRNSAADYDWGADLHRVPA